MVSSSSPIVSLKISSFSPKGSSNSLIVREGRWQSLKKSEGWLFDGVGVCCSGYKTLQNFGLHPNFKAFLGFSPWWSQTIGLIPWDLVELLNPFCLIHHWSLFGMLISISCLPVCFGNFEGLYLCAWVVFALWTKFALTHKIVNTTTQVSSWSFEEISQFVYLLLVIFELVSLSTWLSCWFEVPSHWVVLSVGSWCHECTSSLTFTLSHFSWKSIHQTTLLESNPDLNDLVLLSKTA